MLQETKLNLRNQVIYFFSIYFLFSLKPKFEFFFPKIVEGYKYFHYCLIIWGALFFLLNFQFIISYFRNKLNHLLLLFFATIGITIAYNFTYLSAESIKTSVLTIFVIVIFLPSFQLLLEQYSEAKIFKIIFYPTFVLRVVVNIIGILMYVLNYSLFILDADNILYYAGVRYVELANGKFTFLLYGLYSDPNYSAIYSLAFIFLGLFFLFKFKYRSLFKKILIIIFLLLEFTVFALSNSRGAELAIYIGILFYFFLLIIRFVTKKSERNNTKKIFLKLLMFTLSFFVLNFGIKTVALFILEQNNPVRILIRQENNEYIRLGETTEKEMLKQYISTVDEVSINLEEIKTNTSIVKEDSSKDFGNGRFRIWRDALLLSTKSPIFGFGPDMQKNAAKRFSDIEVPEMYSGRAFHNSYILLYFSFGIVGFIVLGIWFIRVFLRLSVKIIMTENEFSFLFLGVVALMISSSFIDILFVNNDFPQMYLYFILGVLMSGDNLKMHNKIENN